MRRYFYNLGLALSRLLNALAGYSPDRALSHTFARWRNRGVLAGAVACLLLDRLDAGHCDWSLGEPPYHPGVREP